MAWGSLTLAGLLVLAGQSADDISYNNQRSYRIPINVQPARRSEIREMILFVSADKGKSWQQQSVIHPDKDGFVFHAQSDGEYWMRVAVVNQQGKQEPENLYQGKPDQIMVIDTMKPVIKLGTPQRQGEDVEISWEIQEEHPDPGTLKLEYQTAGGPWLPVSITPGPNGKARFRAGATGPVSVRMTFTDRAKNSSLAMAQLGNELARTGFEASSAGTSTPPANQFTTTSAPAPMPPPSPPPIATTAPMPSPPNGIGTPPPLEAPGLGGVRNPSPLPEPRMTTPAPNPIPPSNSTVDTGSRPVATTEGPPPSATAAARGFTGQKALPPVQFANHRELTLEYELAKVGPSGIGSVELYWTPDDGKTWERAPSPDLKDAIKSGRYNRMVELQEGDGIYGFSLVVKSRAGLGKSPPRSGDVPEIRVELDTTAPVAQLFQPRPDPLHRDAIVLSWTARDKNLSATPITLEWAERTDGPWQPIAADLSNSGQHAWQLPSGMPVSVYLRLRVRDQAGNEGVAVTPEPQLVDLTEPEGRLVNVSVTPRR